MIDWDAYFRREEAAIRQLLLRQLPSRTEEIKARWQEVRGQWDALNSRLGWMAVEDVDRELEPPIVFHRVIYGRQIVIEAEGVIVERLGEEE